MVRQTFQTSKPPDSTYSVRRRRWCPASMQGCHRPAAGSCPFDAQVIGVLEGIVSGSKAARIIVAFGRTVHGYTAGTGPVEFAIPQDMQGTDLQEIRYRRR